MKRFQVDASGTLPPWARTGFYNDANRTIYLPAAMAGPEAKVAEAAEEDAVGKFDDSGHAYVPAAWMKRRYPAAAKFVEVFARRWESEPAEAPPIPSEADEWLASIDRIEEESRS